MGLFRKPRSREARRHSWNAPEQEERDSPSREAADREIEGNCAKHATGSHLQKKSEAPPSVSIRGRPLQPLRPFANETIYLASFLQAVSRQCKATTCSDSSFPEPRKRRSASNQETRARRSMSSSSCWETTLRRRFFSRESQRLTRQKSVAPRAHQPNAPPNTKTARVAKGCSIARFSRPYPLMPAKQFNMRVATTPRRRGSTT